MNKVILSGRLCTFPKISVIPIDGSNISVCKFTMAVDDSVLVPIDDNADSAKIPDYFECVAFDSAARSISSCFVKGAKILVTGKVKNFLFQDNNGTSHYTDVVIVDTIEFGDTSSALNRQISYDKAVKLSIVSDLKRVDQHFKSMCEAGFLLINEDDYYNIVSCNFSRE